jgi:hypothetical protein
VIKVLKPGITSGRWPEWHLLKANCRIFVIPAQAGGVVQEEWYKDVPFTEPRMQCTVYGPEDGIQECRHH